MAIKKEKTTIYTCTCCDYRYEISSYLTDFDMGCKPVWMTDSNTDCPNCESVWVTSA